MTTEKQKTNSDIETISGIILIGLIGLIAKVESKRTSLECRNEYRNIQATQCNTLTATRHETNGIDYLSIPLNGEVVKLFYHDGAYQTVNTIKQLESEKAQRQTASNLAARLGVEE